MGGLAETAHRCRASTGPRQAAPYYRSRELWHKGTTMGQWTAGVWEQYVEACDGIGFVAWSTHSRQDLAERAARRYARAARAKTGGALSWSGGVRRPDGHVYWLGQGEERR